MTQMPPFPAQQTPSPQDIRRMVRVNHAGEYGATYIYKGQCAVLGDTPLGQELSHMLAQEEAHLAAFSNEIQARRIRPSALMPLWRAGGYVLGVITARLGPKAAMACTVAVEDAIEAHYHAQEILLQDTPAEQDLHALIAKCRAEELAHRDTGLAHGAAETPGYRLLYKAINGLSKQAIKIAKRL